MNLMDSIKKYFDEEKIKELSDKLGESKETVRKAVDQLIPTVMTTLSEKIQAGKTAIFGFLDKDGDGDFLDDLKAMVGFGDKESGTADDEPVAREAAASAAVFDDKKEEITALISKDSGMSEEKASTLLDEVTASILGFFGQKKGEGFDSAALLDSIKKEGLELQEKLSAHLKSALGFLDKDGDGEILDDLKEAGKNLMGGLFGSKKKEE